MRFLRSFRAALFFARHAGYCPAPEWTPADREALARFLGTGTGARLRMTLTAYITAANERAAVKATPFECGWACGYRGLWAWFQTLSQAGADAGTSEDSGPGMADSLEHFHP